MKTPTAIDKWRDYLAQSFAPILAANAIEAEKDFARYQTGGRILEMQEHLEREYWIDLLAEQGITPDMLAEYIQCFCREIADYVLRDHPED